MTTRDDLRIRPGRLSQARRCHARRAERTHVQAASDAKAFAKRCDDHHHDLLFTVSPEEAMQMDLHTFTGELMTNAEIDLAKRLDWIARSLEYRQRTSMSWCVGVPMAGGT
jgi:type IV secretory pathway VirD2 relaxase